MFKKNNKRKKDSLLPKIDKKSKYISMDIGSYSTKIVVGNVNLGKIKIENAFEVLTGNDLYENGRIIDIEKFKSNIAHGLVLNNIKLKDVIVTIDTSELIKREIILPDIEDMDLSEVISYEIGDYLPIDVNSYVFQPRVMEKFEEEGQKKQRVLVGALPKEMVETIFFNLQDINLQPLILDIHSNSVEKLLNSKFISGFYQTNQSVALIDIGHRLSNVIILEDGEYQFNRILKFGGGILDDVIKSTFGIIDDETKKRLFSNSVIDYVEGKVFESNTVFDQDEILKDNIFNHLLTWIDDVEKILSYYTSRTQNRRIEKIFLYGGCSQLKDLDRLIDKRLSIPTKELNHIDGLDFPVEKRQEVYKYINALSGLIRR